MTEFSDEQLKRLETERNIWVATVRADTRPHLVPVWFAWHNEKVYFCIQCESVKARNLQKNPQIALSLEDGSKVVICEGTTTLIPSPWSEEIAAIFQKKYDWNIYTDEEYNCLLEVTPKKWLTW